MGEDSSNLSFELDFINKEQIQELNKKHRGKDKPTDVLSFPLFRKKDKKHGCLGNIVICKEMAGVFTIDFLIRHGLMHLFGLTHKEMEQYV